MQSTPRLAWLRVGCLLLLTLRKYSRSYTENERMHVPERVGGTTGATRSRIGVRLRLLQSEESSSPEVVVRMAQDVGATEIHLNRKLHSAFLFRDPERCRIFQAIQRRLDAEIRSSRGMHIFKAFWAGWHQGTFQWNDLPFAGDADADWPFAGAWL
ncbi:hypothetical protein AK812_SmicGene13202 [Symbiodinium microadriaticum]|uniref:Uncharacterized protein n=1 Tax=Symbiodinium microadriaticum TaxID=2951 RepID=A0A1Q9E8S5_SYMMI|nr:hypothetical protein AK812_SmicGene13202 [Symbiodinium microadriaticum]